MTIDVGEMFYVPKKDLIHFIGDSFYGDWTIDEFKEFIEALNVRFKEIQEERKKLRND